MMILHLEDRSKGEETSRKQQMVFGFGTVTLKEQEKGPIEIFQLTAD